MKTIINIVGGSLKLDLDIRLVGVVMGDVIVPKGRRFELVGIVTGDVVIDAGGSAQIKGIIAGRLNNQGGEVSVFGFARKAR